MIITIIFENETNANGIKKFGTLEHTQGKNTYFMTFYSSRLPIVFKNNTKISLNKIPEPIKIKMLIEAQKLNWIFLKIKQPVGEA